MFVIDILNFFNQYDRVFKNDIVTNCGREECKKLIFLAYLIETNICSDYGNEHTGMMNIENIQKLRNYSLTQI